MRAISALQMELDKLNPEQREAVECLDGPLLVVAGPGTGKTQLLSLRAANILAKRDASPRNILCLTYTDAGAEAMRRRLVRLVGREAYGIQVSTFHSFASSIRNMYGNYFDRCASDCLVTDLRQREIMDGLLKSRPFDDVLSARSKDGNAYYTSSMLAFVSKVKRSGVSYDLLAEIARQNIAAAEWVEKNSCLCELASKKACADVAFRFEEEVERAYGLAPEELKRSIISTPGVYVPFLVHLLDMVRRADLVNENGRTAEYACLRNMLFGGTNREGRYFNIKERSGKLAAACEVATAYQCKLNEQHLYDFDDMISDFVRTVEVNGELRQALQDRYAYLQVDEFQDTNGAQMRIVELLCEGIESPNVMAVGDDDQAIMRFQGASVECINQFVNRYRPQRIVLKTNYRSTPEVIDLGGNVAAQIAHRLISSENKRIKAACPSSDQTEFVELAFRGKAEEYAALAKSIRAQIDRGYLDTCSSPETAIAVISPKHTSLQALMPYLVAENIPFAYRQTESLFELECMQTILALMHCVVALSQGRRALAESYLPRIVCAPEFGGDHPSSVRFAFEVRREFHGDWLHAMRFSNNARIRDLYEQLEGWAAKCTTSPVRDLLFDMSDSSLAYYRRKTDVDPLVSAQFNVGMRALLDFAQGELGLDGGKGHVLRLADIVNRLDMAQAQGVSISAGIELDSPEAIRLTTAHSSKGLEFDCVYLVDADDATWHKGASSGSLYPDNLLMADEKDEDDERRLLFVALTRAKRHLVLYRGPGETIRELSGLVATREVATDPSELDAALEIEWRNNYRLDSPRLVALLDADSDIKHLTASALNTFVTYQIGCENSELFPERQALRLPEKPKIALEFGNIVHAMMEDVSNHVLGRATKSLEDIVEACRQSILWMDYPQTDIDQYSYRFKRICDSFIPWFIEHAQGFRCMPEVELQACTAAGAPLFGRLDLLLVNDVEKTVRIVDYKTGLNPKVPEGYERQLRFYKLLVELSPQFQGYTVSEMCDYYVEPGKETGQLRAPYAISATEDEMTALERLVDAVWRRIAAGAWDTSAFEQSEGYRCALRQQERERAKADKAHVMQAAYEEWLIADDNRIS